MTPSQKAIQDAQAAYEKEQSELKGQLEKDPLWQPSHENVAMIKPGKGPIESFCRNKEGNLLICCSGEEPSLLAGLLAHKADSQHGEVAVFSPKGKKIADWKMPFPTQAICLGDEGVIYVAGGGRIAKLDTSGKVVAQADTPNSRELPPVSRSEEGAEERRRRWPRRPKRPRGKRSPIWPSRCSRHRRTYMDAVTAGQKERQAQRRPVDAGISGKAPRPMEKLQAAQQELQEATMTPEMRAAQERAMRERMMTITGMAVTDRDLFVCCAFNQGFRLYRLAHGPRLRQA